MTKANDQEKTQETQDKQEAPKAAQQVQETVDAEQEQGFRGTKVDPTPNENYTVAGQANGAKTPETDPELAAEAAKASNVRR